MIRLNVDYGDLKMYYEQKDWEKGVFELVPVVNHVPHRLLGIDVDGVFNLLESGEYKLKDLYKFAPEKEYKPIIHSLLSEHLFNSRFDVFKLNPQFENDSKFKGKLIFISDEGWVSIKKKSVDKNTSNREVAAFLLGVKASAVSRIAYSNLSESTMKDLEKRAKGSKGLSRVLSLLEEINNPWEFAYMGALLGYPITPTAAVLKKVFPELKLPGIKGRRAGPSRVL